MFHQIMKENSSDEKEMISMLQMIIKKSLQAGKQLIPDINSKLPERTKRANKRNYVGSSKRLCGNIFLLLSFN